MIRGWQEGPQSNPLAVIGYLSDEREWTLVALIDEYDVTEGKGGKGERGDKGGAADPNEMGLMRLAANRFTSREEGTNQEEYSGGMMKLNGNWKIRCSISINSLFGAKVNGLSKLFLCSSHS